MLASYSHTPVSSFLSKVRRGFDYGTSTKKFTDSNSAGKQCPKVSSWSIAGNYAPSRINRRVIHRIIGMAELVALIPDTAARTEESSSSSLLLDVVDGDCDDGKEGSLEGAAVVDDCTGTSVTGSSLPVVVGLSLVAAVGEGQALGSSVTLLDVVDDDSEGDKEGTVEGAEVTENCAGTSVTGSRLEMVVWLSLFATVGVSLGQMLGFSETAADGAFDSSFDTITPPPPEGATDGVSVGGNVINNDGSVVVNGGRTTVPIVFVGLAVGSPVVGAAVPTTDDGFRKVSYIMTIRSI